MATNSRPRGLSWTTRLNWLLDFAVFLGALLSAITGIYFLFFVSGGRQSAAALIPLSGITFLFEREAWSDWHTWGGVLMIAAVALHLAIHTNWIGMMSRKLIAVFKGQGRGMSRGARINVAVDAVIGISFLLTALSGLYFLFLTSGGYEGGRNPAYAPLFLFSRTTWDLIHTWAGVAMIVAAVVHLAIHWGWVTKVTAKIFGGLTQRPQRPVAAPKVSKA